MTDFIPSFSTQHILPPCVSVGSKNWIFVIDIDRECIQDYLDAWFNSAGPELAPFYWRAMESSAYGVLMVCEHPDYSSERNGEPGFNSLSHTEVFWFFPVRRHARRPDNLLLDEGEVVWIQPFALDDSSDVMFSSREVWGCEKDMAYIKAYEGKTPDDLHIDIAMEGCKTFTPKSISHRIGVMHIAMKPSQAAFDWGEVFNDPNLGELYGDLVAYLMSPAKGVSDDQNNMEINTLKQFRDAFDLQDAAYRAIIASRLTHTDVSKTRHYSSDQVTMDFMWSASFAERFTKLFGLKAPPEDSPEKGHPAGSAFLTFPGIDWDMPRVTPKVAFAASFTANSRFEVLDTLHTYGLEGVG